MPMPSRTGAQRWPIVTAVPLSVREVPRRHSRLSPPKHKGSTSSGPTNSATLTTTATTASLPGLRSTQAASRPLNNRIMLAIRQRRERASALPHINRPSCLVAVLMPRSLPAYCHYSQTITLPLWVQGRLCVCVLCAYHPQHLLSRPSRRVGLTAEQRKPCCRKYKLTQVA